MNGGNDLPNVLVAKSVLVSSRSKFPRRFDEQYLLSTRRFLVSVEHQDGGGDTCSIEKVGGKPYNGLNEVLLKNPLPDFALSSPPEEA
jgi:hypothetical protein